MKKYDMHNWYMVDRDKVTWTDMYDDEQELIDDLLKIDINIYKYKCYKAYQYVKEFQKYYIENGTLTSKQLTQLKRISKEIFKYNMKLKEMMMIG